MECWGRQRRRRTDRRVDRGDRWSLIPDASNGVGGVWIFAGTLALFAFNRNFYVAIALLALGGFGIVLYFSTSNTVVQTIVPDEMRGRVMGIWTLILAG